MIPDPTDPPVTRVGRAGRVVLVGGYGHVGLRLAGILAPRFPGRVVIAGRNLAAAQRAAARLGHGSRAARLHADSLTNSAGADELGHALAGADLVVACAGQSSSTLAQASLQAGVHYADVTADGALIADVEALDPLARRHDAAAVLSVGLAPGLTNLLAAAACAGLDTVERVDLLVQLGLGDPHGPAAISWTLDGLDDEFDVPEPEGPRRVRAFCELRRFTQPRTMPDARPATQRPPVGYRFNFPEQRTLPRTLGVPAVASWLALEPPLAGAALALAARGGLARLLRPPLARRLTLSALTRVHLGSDRAGAAATATGTRAGASAECTLAVTGNGEATLTASVAAAVVEQLLTGNVQRGVHHIEEIIDAAAVLSSLSSPHATLDAGPAARS